MSASWPTSIPTDATLYIAVNELQTNLSSGVNNAVTTLTLNSTTSFPTVGLVLIDNEIIKYTGVSGSNLTGCTRGFDGTTATSHSAAAIVSFAICANHHNVTKDEIIALATYLSNNLGTGAQPLATGSRALASNGSGKIVESSVTSTELGYLSGVTSAIQTQLGTKAPSASPTFTGTITTPLTANRALATGASGVLAVSATTDTELGYVSGVTSAIQTQLGTKAPTANPTLTGTVTVPNGAAATSAAAFGQLFNGFQAPVQFTTTTTTSVTSNAFTATALTATITPTSSSHRIRIHIDGTWGFGDSTRSYFLTIERGTTNLAGADGFAFMTGVGTTLVSRDFIDSPATGSAVTYTVYIRNDNSVATTTFPGGGVSATGVIILDEIV